MFLQKKPIMQILAANILMGISTVKTVTVIVKLGRATRMDKIRCFFLLNVKKVILCSGEGPMKTI